MGEYVTEWGMTSSMAAAKIITDTISGTVSEYTGIFNPSRSMLSKQLFANIGVALADFIIPTTKRCSHLGCALKHNKSEHSWDCVCHGSRFEENGNIIDNPATKNLNI